MASNLFQNSGFYTPHSLDPCSFISSVIYLFVCLVRNVKKLCFQVYGSRSHFKLNLIVVRVMFFFEKKKKTFYLPSAVFVAQVPVGPSKQLKQIFQIEHNIVKNPNWPEANQLAIYKRGAPQI